MINAEVIKNSFAIRLESEAGKDQILISGETREKVKSIYVR